MNWVTVDALREHWKEARVDARVDPSGTVDISVRNVTALTLEFPPGYSPFPLGTPAKVRINSNGILAPARSSDRSWGISLIEDANDGSWSSAPQQAGGLRKRHDLQGPIDDAFMDSFMFVRPTAKSPNPNFQAWLDAEMPRAIEHWRRHFRGEPRVKDDRDVNETDIATSHLVLWGDPASNSVIRQVADRLPIAWNAKSLRAGDTTFDSGDHALLLIYPNPLNASRYLVLNSGFTFREYDYLNNARQVPKLPDWAVIDLRTPPDSRFPGKVVAADFFGERWELRAGRRDP
jgi:hypothetical protein